MKQNVKENEYADGLVIEINKVTAIENPKNVGEIIKIVFETNKGDITYKPKTKQVEMKRGVSVTTEVGCLFDDMPDKFFKLVAATNEKGMAKVKAFYNIWNTNKDGEDITYRYIRGNKMFDKWELVEDQSGEEKVVG